MKYCHLQYVNGPREYSTFSKKSEKDKILYDITYMWNLKNDMNLYSKQKHSQK